MHLYHLIRLNNTSRKDSVLCIWRQAVMIKTLDAIPEFVSRRHTIIAGRNALSRLLIPYLSLQSELIAFS